MIKKFKKLVKNIFGNSNSKFLNVEVMKGALISADTLIGEYSYIGFNSFITKSNIGRYCSIGANVSIGLGEHVIDGISTSSLFYKNPYSILTQKDCIIGNDVWIGVDSIIRRGVKIGNGAIVGANSFVNKNVPPFAIVAGVPATIIKYRFSDEQIVKIADSNWWDFNIKEAQVIISTLSKELDVVDISIL